MKNKEAYEKPNVKVVTLDEALVVYASCGGETCTSYCPTECNSQHPCNPECGVYSG